jgi:hypothetical protein
VVQQNITLFDITGDPCLYVLLCDVTAGSSQPAKCKQSLVHSIEAVLPCNQCLFVNNIFDCDIETYF